MSSQKHTPLGSRRNTMTSNISKDESINLYNNPFNQTPSVLLSNQKAPRSNTPTQQLFSDQKSRSKSPAVKTFKEIRNVSPNRTSQEFIALGTSMQNREKIDLNASVIMNKGFSTCDDFKDVLKKIFGFYASFGDRINRDALKSNNLVKLVHDAGLMDKSNITPNNINILFCKHSLKASTIDFDKFLLIVIDIASIRYPDTPQKEAFFQLFTEVLKPLYLSLYRETNLGEHDILFQEPLEPETLSIIGETTPVLTKLHHFIFSTEYQSPDFKTAKAKSEFLLPSFFKEFELSPFLINLSLGHSLYREILNVDNAYLKRHFTIPQVLEKDQGKAFTLKRFLLYLVRVSIVGFSSPWCQDQVEGDQDNFSQQDKLVLLLEKMEVSPGFIRFRKHIASLGTASVSLLPSKTTMKRLLNKRKARTDAFRHENLNTSQLRTNEDVQISQPIASLPNFTEPQATQQDTEPVLKELYITNDLFSHRRANTRSPSPIKQSQLLELLPSTAPVFESNKELLEEIFKAYCSYLNSKSDYTMKVMNLVNLFKNACLLKEKSGQDQPRVSSMVDEELNNEQGIMDKNRMLSQMQLELYVKKLLTNGYNGMRASRVHTNKSFDMYLPTEEADEVEPNSARHKGVNFEIFVKVVEYVALYNYPDVDEEAAVKCVITQHLQKVLNGEKLQSLGNDVKGQLKQLMEILKDPMLMDIVAMIKRRLQPFYKEYCVLKEDYVEFEGFMNFYRFYGIFPQLISRMRLVQLFHNLSALFPLLGEKKENNARARQTHKRESIENKKGIIDENLFVESLVVCALETNEAHLNHPLEKILFLVGRMKENLDGVILKKKSSPFVILELTKKQKALMEILTYIQSKGADIHPIRSNTAPRGVKRFEDLF